MGIGPKARRGQQAECRKRRAATAKRIASSQGRSECAGHPANERRSLQTLRHFQPFCQPASVLP